MAELTRYWQRKRKAVDDLLKTGGLTDVTLPSGAAGIATLTTWFNALTATPDVANSLESKLKTAIDGVVTSYSGVGGGSGNNRRSVRLCKMIQDAAGIRRRGRRFHATVGDVFAGQVPAHMTSLQTASMRAADFVDAAKNGRTNVEAAIRLLVDANDAKLSEKLKRELKELHQDIWYSLPAPGSGDGSSYWPSVFVNSSSSSGG